MSVPRWVVPFIKREILSLRSSATRLERDLEQNPRDPKWSGVALKMIERKRKFAEELQLDYEISTEESLLQGYEKWLAYPNLGR
jgi:hypothetical protein